LSHLSLLYIICPYYLSHFPLGYNLSSALESGSDEHSSNIGIDNCYDEEEDVDDDEVEDEDDEFDEDGSDGDDPDGDDDGDGSDGDGSDGDDSDEDDSDGDDDGIDSDVAEATVQKQKKLKTVLSSTPGLNAAACSQRQSEGTLCSILFVTGSHPVNHL
jgi:hypothetical protein